MTTSTADEREQIACDHKCHDQGLNPWIKECSICGCVNPTYDPKRIAPFDDLEDFWGFGG